MNIYKYVLGLLLVLVAAFFIHTWAKVAGMMGAPSFLVTIGFYIGAFLMIGATEENR